jgi:hypothetical protein
MADFSDSGLKPRGELPPPIRRLFRAGFHIHQSVRPIRADALMFVADLAPQGLALLDVGLVFDPPINRFPSCLSSPFFFTRIPL